MGYVNNPVVYSSADPGRFSMEWDLLQYFFLY